MTLIHDDDCSVSELQLIGSQVKKVKNQVKDERVRLDLDAGHLGPPGGVQCDSLL